MRDGDGAFYSPDRRAGNRVVVWRSTESGLPRSAPRSRREAADMKVEAIGVRLPARHGCSNGVVVPGEPVNQAVHDPPTAAAVDPLDARHGARTEGGSAGRQDAPGKSPVATAWICVLATYHMSQKEETMADRKAPTHVLALIARAMNNTAAKKARQKASQPTVGKRIKLRRATPPTDGGGKGKR